MGQLAHLSNYLEFDNCEVVAVADLRYELAKNVADTYHIPKVYKDHKELAADDEIEAVVAILHFTTNGPVAKDLLNAGKHVFLEKPMACSLKEAEEMVEAAERNSVKLMIGFMKRYDKGVEKGKAVLDEWKETEEQGPMTFVRSHCFGGDWLCNVGSPIKTDEPYPTIKLEDRHPGWMSEKMAKEFDDFNNIFSHNINLLRFLLGDDLEVEFAKFTDISKAMVFRFGEAMGTMEGGYLSARWWDEETKIYFRDGWINILTPPPMHKNTPARVEIYKAGDKQEISYPLAEWSWGFRLEGVHFLDCIINDKVPLSSGKDSLRDMAISEAIFRKRLEIE